MFPQLCSAMLKLLMQPMNQAEVSVLHLFCLLFASVEEHLLTYYSIGQYMLSQSSHLFFFIPVSVFLCCYPPGFLTVITCSVLTCGSRATAN